MDKVALYLFIILTYLGLANSLSPYRQYIIRNESMLSEVFPSDNLSIVIDDMNSTGFLLKTKYHVYKVFYGFSSVPEIHRFQVSSKFYQSHILHLGMSILNRGQSHKEEIHLPLPPGALIFGDPVFGRWKTSQDGESEWTFHAPYKKLPAYLGLGDFIVNQMFYEELNSAIEQGQPYFGPTNEFGTAGKITKLRYQKDESRPDLKNQIWSSLTKLTYNPYKTSQNE